MPGRKQRGLEIRLVASAGACLLTLAAILNAAPPTTALIDASNPSIHLMSYDSAGGGLSDLPPLGAFNFDFTVPGLGTFDIYDTGGILPTDYGYGLTFAGDDISFTSVSQGTSAGLSSTVTLQTAMGGFSNTESYATSYWGLACLICNTFQITDPSGAAIITADTDIYLNGPAQFDLTTPWGTFDFPPSDVTASALAEPLMGLSALASDPASSLSNLLDLPGLIP